MLGAARTAQLAGWNVAAPAPGRTVGDASTNTSITYTRIGSAVTSTTQYKFGTASMYEPDNNGDYISTNNSAATYFDFGTGDYTVEWWMWLSADARTREADLMAVNQAGGFGLRLGRGWNNLGGVNINALGFFARQQADMDYYDYTWPREQWIFVAVQRASSVVNVWVDGAKLTKTGGSGATTRNYVTRTGGSVNSFGNTTENVPGIGPGYMDEVCITKGFARYTPDAATIPVPTEPFFVDTYCSQLLHMDGSNNGTTFTNATS